MGGACQGQRGAREGENQEYNQQGWSRWPLGEAGIENKPKCLTAPSPCRSLCFLRINSFHPDTSPHLLMETDGQSAKYSKVTQLGQGRDGDVSLGDQRVLVTTL